MSEKKPITAAIIHRNNEVLLIERRMSEGSLLWAFVSGEIEDGESPADAARREALEEMGLSVISSEVIGSRVHPHTKREMSYVACQLVDAQQEAEVLDEDEIASFRWCSFDEMEDLTGGTVFEPVREYLRARLG